MTKASQRFSFCDDARALRVDVDPWFDVLRGLSVRETPASIGELLGNENILAVIPGAASADEQERWRRIAGSLQIEAVDDTALDALPRGRSVWLFGRSNRYLAPVIGLEATKAKGELLLENTRVSLDKHAVFVVRRAGESVIGVASVPEGGDPEAFITRLQHYTRYSYLGFAPGDRRASVRGQWPVLHSPLSVQLDASHQVPLRIPPRQALISPGG